MGNHTINRSFSVLCMMSTLSMKEKQSTEIAETPPPPPPLEPITNLNDGKSPNGTINIVSPQNEDNIVIRQNDQETIEQTPVKYEYKYIPNEKENDMEMVESN